LNLAGRSRRVVLSAPARVCARRRSGFRPQNSRRPARRHGDVGCRPAPPPALPVLGQIAAGAQRVGLFGVVRRRHARPWPGFAPLGDSHHHPCKGVHGHALSVHQGCEKMFCQIDQHGLALLPGRPGRKGNLATRSRSRTRFVVERPASGAGEAGARQRFGHRKRPALGPAVSEAGGGGGGKTHFNTPQQATRLARVSRGKKARSWGPEGERFDEAVGEAPLLRSAGP